MRLRRPELRRHVAAALGNNNPAARAFTLLEVVLATGLVVVLTGVMFAFYNSSMALRERGTTVVRDTQLVRVVMDRVCNEIRQATGYGGGFGTGLFGDRYALSINTLVIPDKGLSEKLQLEDEPLPGQFDLQEVRYYIGYDEDHLDENGYPTAKGLVRRTIKTFNTDVINLDEEEDVSDAQKSVKEELYAPEIKCITFRYFDGVTWWDDWKIKQGNALPQIVRVTIGYVPHSPQEEQDERSDISIDEEEKRQPLPRDQYTRFVRVIQADAFFGSRLQREASALSESSLDEP